MANKKLNTYRLHFATKEYYYYVYVKAASLDEAIEKAKEIESSQLKSTEDTLEYEFDREFTINTNLKQEV